MRRVSQVSTTQRAPNKCFPNHISDWELRENPRALFELSGHK